MRQKQQRHQLNSSPGDQARRAGLSLIEILVALALIGASSLLFTFFSGVFRATRSAQIDTQALNVARSHLDRLRASIAAGVHPASAKSEKDPNLPPGYEIDIPTPTAVANSNSKLWRIEVRVKGPGGQTRQFVTTVTPPR